MSKLQSKVPNVMSSTEILEEEFRVQIRRVVSAILMADDNEADADQYLRGLADVPGYEDYTQPLNPGELLSMIAVLRHAAKELAFLRHTIGDYDAWEKYQDRLASHQCPRTHVHRVGSSDCPNCEADRKYMHETKDDY